MSHMAEPTTQGPHPWLSYVTCALLGVGTSFVTTSFTAGEKAAELRQTQAQVAELRQEMAAVRLQANGTDLVVARLEEQLKHIRSGVDDLKALLQGRTTKYVRGE